MLFHEYLAAYGYYYILGMQYSRYLIVWLCYPCDITFHPIIT